MGLYNYIPITINNMTVEQADKACKMESLWLKIAKFLSAILTGVVAIFLATYFFKHVKNVNTVQDNCMTILSDEVNYLCKNTTLYDSYFSFRDGPFEDWVAEDDAGHFTYLLSQCDLKCQTIGNRWSKIYTLCAISAIGFVVQALVLALGVFIYPSRLVGLMCQTMCCCFNLGTLLTTAVFRFNTMGRFASISMSPSYYDVDTGAVTDKTTYQTDGQMILRLWVLGLVFIILQCCLGCFASAPPTQNTLRKKGIDFNQEYDEQGRLIQRTSL